MKKNLTTGIVISIIITGLIVWAFSYAPTRSEIYKERTENAAFHIENTYTIIIIEKCEYVVYSNHINQGGAGYMAHKGNCNNH